jgi:hypothetical protein
MATLPVLAVLLFLTLLATVSGEFNLGFHFIFKHLYPTVSFISFVATGIMRAMKLVVSVSQF